MSAATIVVWVLIAYLPGIKQGGPLVVDNIASAQNCEALAREVRAANLSSFNAYTKCIAVRKVRTTP